MKFRAVLISICAAGLAMAQTATPTQGNPPRGRGPRGAIGVRGRGLPRSPGGILNPNSEARLTRALGLDAGQQNTLHSVIAGSQVQQQGMADHLKSLRTQLSTAVKADDEAAIDSVTQEIQTVQQQQASIRAKSLATIYKSLNADQRQKFEPLMTRELWQGGPEFGPGPGGRGPAGFRRGPRARGQQPAAPQQ